MSPCLRPSRTTPVLGQGAYQAVSDAKGSEHTTGSIRLGASWNSLPESEEVPLEGTADTVAVDLLADRHSCVATEELGICVAGFGELDAEQFGWDQAAAAGLIATCPITELEFFYCARSATDRAQAPRTCACS